MSPPSDGKFRGAVRGHGTRTEIHIMSENDNNDVRFCKGCHKQHGDERTDGSVVTVMKRWVAQGKTRMLCRECWDKGMALQKDGQDRATEPPKRPVVN